MKAFVMILTATLLPQICFAAPIEKLYYVGEVKLSDPSGKPFATQVILLEKVLDPDNSQARGACLLLSRERERKDTILGLMEDVPMPAGAADSPGHSSPTA
jgi:hypothetical protein